MTSGVDIFSKPNVPLETMVRLCSQKVVHAGSARICTAKFCITMQTCLVCFVNSDRIYAHRQDMTGFCRTELESDYIHITGTVGAPIAACNTLVGMLLTARSERHFRKLHSVP